MFSEEHVIYRYKYMPFSEGTLKTLTDGTMKFTNPVEFNDPFDCLPHYVLESINEIPKRRPDLIRAASDRKELSPAGRLKEKGKMIAQLKHRIADGSLARDLLSGIGVVSLSKNALNIPMWSHYADFHRGLVLEFRIPTAGHEIDLLLATDRLLPFPVTYSQQRPHIEVGVENPRELLQKLLLTKSTDWRYEDEERVIDHERGSGIHPYRRDEILTSVIAGIKTSEADFRRLQEIVVQLTRSSIPSLNLWHAEPVPGEYRLRVPGHQRLNNGQNIGSN